MTHFLLAFCSRSFHSAPFPDCLFKGGVVTCADRIIIPSFQQDTLLFLTNATRSSEFEDN